VDAIESGLVKIPQLAVRDTSGAPVPYYFNVWKWVTDRLTPAERGGRKGSVKPERCSNGRTRDRHAGRLWELLRVTGRPRREPAAGVHHRLQEHEDARWCTSGWRRIKRRPAYRHPDSRASAIGMGRSTRSAWTQRSCTRPTAERQERRNRVDAPDAGHGGKVDCRAIARATLYPRL